MATKNSTSKQTGWTSTQIYTAIIVVLIIGALGGYLMRGGNSTSSAPATSAPAQAPAGAASPNALQMQVSNLQARLQSNPNDVDAAKELGDIYFDAARWNEAIKYYTQYLAANSKNPDVRTDLGTAYFNTGDADRALKEFDQALKDDPSHAQTMYNVGIVKLNGKKDPKGAIAAWEQLLKANPNYPDRAGVEQLLATAKAQVK